MSLLDKTNQSSRNHRLDETEDIDIDAEQQLVRAYAQQESEMKSGKIKLLHDVFLPPKSSSAVVYYG